MREVFVVHSVKENDYDLYINYFVVLNTIPLYFDVWFTAYLFIRWNKPSCTAHEVVAWHVPTAWHHGHTDKWPA